MGLLVTKRLWLREQQRHSNGDSKSPHGDKRQRQMFRQRPPSVASNTEFPRNGIFPARCCPEVVSILPLLELPFCGEAVAVAADAADAASPFSRPTAILVDTPAAESLTSPGS